MEEGLCSVKADLMSLLRSTEGFQGGLVVPSCQDIPLSFLNPDSSLQYIFASAIQPGGTGREKEVLTRKLVHHK